MSGGVIDWVGVSIFCLAMKGITERRQSFHVSVSEQAALHVMDVCKNNERENQHGAIMSKSACQVTLEVYA